MVIVPDGGSVYRSWQERGVPRVWSEHASEATVYDVPACVGNVLVGTTSVGDTWFQWERSRCCSLMHAVDWLKYLCTGRNQGPYGQSCRTDEDPIVLLRDSFRAPSTEEQEGGCYGGG